MRSRVVIGAAVGVAVLGGLAAATVPVIGASDAATTEIRVAADSPTPPEPAPLPASVRPLWTKPASVGAPPATPVEGPTAVAAGPDRVAGLDPATGRERWSYRRGNARLCDWTARDEVVLALFAKSSGCRDLVGLDAATGSRRWYRTIEVTTDAVLTSGPGVAVVTAGSQLVAVDTVTGLNRWTYAGDGCPLDPVVVGPEAAATVARCPGGEVRLVGHDPYAEKAAWTVPQPAGSDPRVVAADEEIAVLTRGGGRPVLTGYVPAEGKDRKPEGRRVGSVADARLGYESGAVVSAVTEGQVVVLWTGRAAVAVDGRTRAVLWSAPASGPPAITEGQVLLADAGRLTLRPVVEGRPGTAVAVSDGTIPAGAVLSRVGRLVVAAGVDRLAAFG